MTSFTLRRAAKPDAEGYIRTVIQGYADKGKVARYLTDGWEIEGSSPVMFGGTNFGRQMIFTLRKKVS